MVLKLYDPAKRGHYITVSVTDVFNAPAVLVLEWVGARLIRTVSLTPMQQRGAAEDLRNRTITNYRARGYSENTPQRNFIALSH